MPSALQESRQHEWPNVSLAIHVWLQFFASGAHVVGLAVPDLGSLLYQCEVPGIYDSTNKSGISSYIVGEAE